MATVVITNINAVDGIYSIKSEVSGIPGADVVQNIVHLTQAEYDALATLDNNTAYMITEE